MNWQLWRQRQQKRGSDETAASCKKNFNWLNLQTSKFSSLPNIDISFTFLYGIHKNT